MFIICRLPLAFLLLFFLALPAQAALFQNVSSKLAGEAQKAQQEGKLLVVLFELEDCDICQRLKADVFSEYDTERQFGRDFRAVSVSLDQDAEITTPDGKIMSRQRWAQQIGVVGTPAFAFFDGHGKLLYRHLGPVANRQELLLLGRYVRTEAFENLPWSVYLEQQRSTLHGATKDDICRGKSQAL
jgi:thioredoxin-related protein